MSRRNIYNFTTAYLAQGKTNLAGSTNLYGIESYFLNKWITNLFISQLLELQFRQETP